MGPGLAGPGDAGVEAEDAFEAGVAFGRREGLVGELAGVGADEVVEAVALGRDGLEQVEVDEAFEDGIGAADGDVEQMGRDDREQVCSVGDAQQWQRPRGFAVEVAIAGLQEAHGTGNARADAGLVGAEAVEPAFLVVEEIDQVLDRPGRAGGEPAADQPHGQWQATGERGEHLRRVRLGSDAGLADDSAEELDGLRLRQRVEPDLACTRQRCKRTTAGDDRSRARAAGEQWHHLPSVGSIVEQHQHPAPGELRSQQGCRFLDGFRDQLGVQTERTKQLAQGVGGAHRLTRSVAAQVEIEMAVGVTVGQSVRGLNRQRRLADTAHTGDRDQADGIAAQAGGSSQNRQNRLDLGSPAGEVRHRRR